MYFSGLYIDKVACSILINEAQISNKPFTKCEHESYNLPLSVSQMIFN